MTDRNNYLAYQRRYAAAHRDTARARAMEYYRKNREKIREKARAEYKKCPDSFLIPNREWRRENRESINARKLERLNQNPIERVKKNLRSRLTKFVNREGRGSISKLIGCDWVTFKNWIESMFKDGMTWENYGSYWHVDHRIPCSIFNLEDPYHQRRCFCYTNLQPMKASDNIRKAADVDPEEALSIHNSL